MEDKKVTLCEDCIHVIRRIGKTVDYEAHRSPVKSKKECEAYLSIKCEDEKQITKSNYICRRYDVRRTRETYVCKKVYRSN